ncbi:MAG: Penicillin-binding protein 2 [Actinomycetota bacterium]|nr:Penicillin-binding protein 2 [Actinomycetota bacterium]MDQ5975348.1 penicillin-binding protein 2 [Actinomycetota bacterium]
MSERSNLRLLVLAVLVASLLGTLVIRTFYLQVMTGETYRAAAEDNTVREVVEPAVRGLVLDQAGRPLVSNRTSVVVTVDRQTLKKEKDEGVEVIDRLAKILDMPAGKITERLANCGTEGAKPPPICWNGSNYQPIPVANDVDTQTALTIMERRSDFPGISAKLQAVREYPSPFNVNAAHLLGYLGPVTEEQIQAQGDSQEVDRLRITDVVGRTGLEREYDAELRGSPGITALAVDTAGQVTGTLASKPPTAGDYVVTSLDAHLQSVVERQLVAAVERARNQGYPGKSGAAVVVDVRTGQVLAMASYPTYDPSIWIGGVTKKQYKDLIGSEALSSNAYQGLFAPGSTFKVISTAAAGKEGYSLYGDYACPSQVKVGGQTFRNFESSAYGRISLQRAIEVSCNTVFYGLAERMWLAAGGPEADRESADPVAETAKLFGLGSATGIDLPGEAVGRVSSRAFKADNWEAMKDTWCANASAGYPETRKTDPKLADYYTALDKENCTDGYQWRAGDALNAVIGQGDTAVTPLQMAMVYAAVANGGKLYQPQVAKAIVSASGEVVKEFQPVLKSQVTVPKTTMTFLRRTLPGVTTNGSGETPFQGFPLDQIPVASKTGSAQVTGSDVSTSWFASYAPADKPRYAVVMMVTEGGTGSKTSGPSVRRIYESLFGVTNGVVDPSRSVLIGGEPQAALPVIASDGTVTGPTGKKAGVVSARAASGRSR